MSRRPRTEQNGNGYHYSSHNGHKLSPRITLRRSPSWSSLIGLCLLGATVAIGAQYFKLLDFAPQTSAAEPFRWAVNRAMSAAELTQVAASNEEWLTVATWWQEAIELMQAVPASNPNYSVAQAKVAEYQRNLSYAQGKVLKQNTSSDNPESVWTLGTRREALLQIQGAPTRSVRYDALCKEVLYYGGSTVELSHGMVATYSDVDRNLRVSVNANSIAPSDTNPSQWTLGSTRDKVLRIQGTPNRVENYEFLDQEILYYGQSTITLKGNRVISYNNFGDNLNVVVGAATATPPQASTPFWTIGSMRDDVFRVQGTPDQVTLNNSLCTETLHYGSSTINLKNGVVSEYNNLAQNLKVQVN